MCHALRGRTDDARTVISLTRGVIRVDSRIDPLKESSHRELQQVIGIFMLIWMVMMSILGD